jgi:hypothetical protein
MAVTTSTTLVQYVGNESSVTPYPVTFRVDSASHLRVGTRAYLEAVEEFTLLDTSAYQVNLDEETGTAEVITDDEISADLYVGIWREVPYTQDREYPVSGPFPSQSHEMALDKLTMLVQQLKAELDRALVMRTYTTQTGDNLIPPASYGLVGFDSGKVGTIFDFTTLEQIISPWKTTVQVFDVNPTTDDIPDGFASIWVNTAQPINQRVKLWANVGGNFFNMILGDAGA